MKIQDLENRTGLERPTIRFYEREGLITPVRKENGYREYSDADIDQLLKIKLLRQLGMSVEKIRALQQGSADFSAALTDQASKLTTQIQEHQQAREVCKLMRDDGVDYQTMDPERYLRLYRELSVQQLPVQQEFQEELEKEIHPWRRYIARTVDYMLFGGLVELILFVVLRIRPIPGEIVSILIGCGCVLLFAPLEALMLSKWGTTPGKWAMGIRLEYIQGGNLPYAEALYRACRVWYGVGFGIPYVALFCYGRCYCKLTGRSWRLFARHDEVKPPADMDWDEETEIIYSPWNWKGKGALAALVALCLLISGITIVDMVKPRYRGSELTVAEFAENYNSTLRFLYEDHKHYEELQSDGSKKPVPVNVGITSPGGEAENLRREFTYETEDGYLRDVCYENHWTGVYYLYPLSGECYYAAAAALLAQDGCGFAELKKFSELWESWSGETTANFQYENLQISWEIRYADCSKYGGMYTSSLSETKAENDSSSVDMVFRLTILES